MKPWRQCSAIAAQQCASGARQFQNCYSMAAATNLATRVSTGNRLLTTDELKEVSYIDIADKKTVVARLTETDGKMRRFLVNPADGEFITVRGKKVQLYGVDKDPVRKAAWRKNAVWKCSDDVEVGEGASRAYLVYEVPINFVEDEDC